MSKTGHPGRIRHQGPVQKGPVQKGPRQKGLGQKGSGQSEMVALTDLGYDLSRLPIERQRSEDE